MNIYFDIDGVLKSAESSIEDRETLVRYALDNFPGHVYWLTSYCKHGKNNAVYVLRNVFGEELLDRLGAEVAVADWSTSKLQGIDMDTPYMWMDDNPYEGYDIDGLFYMNPYDANAAKKALAEMKRLKDLYC